MPEYSFKCGDCSHEFSLIQGMATPRPKSCPNCRKRKNFGQVIDAPVGLRGEPRTVGSLAEKNSRRLGKERLDQELNKEVGVSDTMRKKIEAAGGIIKKQKKPSGVIPWYRDGSVPGTERSDKPLDIAKIADINKYIETGKKS